MQRDQTTALLSDRHYALARAIGKLTSEIMELQKKNISTRLEEQDKQVLLEIIKELK